MYPSDYNAAIARVHKFKGNRLVPLTVDHTQRAPGRSLDREERVVHTTCFDFQRPCRKRRPIKAACITQPRVRADQTPPASRPNGRESR